MSLEYSLFCMMTLSFFCENCWNAFRSNIEELDWLATSRLFLSRGASREGLDSTESCTWWISKLEADGEIPTTEADFEEVFSMGIVLRLDEGVCTDLVSCYIWAACLVRWLRLLSPFSSSARYASLSFCRWYSPGSVFCCWRAPCIGRRCFSCRMVPEA